MQGNQLPILEETQEYFQYLQQKTTRQRVFNYLGLASDHQVDKTCRERTLLTLIEEASALRLSERAIQLAITYFDLYLSKSSTISLAELDLIAFACLQLACVFEYCKDFGASQTRRYSHLSEETLGSHKLQILAILEFNLDQPTVSDFLLLVLEVLGQTSTYLVEECERMAVLAYASADLAFEGPMLLGFTVANYVMTRSSKPDTAQQVVELARQMAGIDISRLEACKRLLADIWFTETASIQYEPCVWGLN